MDLLQRASQYEFGTKLCKIKSVNSAFNKIISTKLFYKIKINKLSELLNYKLRDRTAKTARRHPNERFYFNFSNHKWPGVAILLNITWKLKIYSLRTYHLVSPLEAPHEIGGASRTFCFRCP